MLGLIFHRRAFHSIALNHYKSLMFDSIGGQPTMSQKSWYSCGVLSASALILVALHGGLPVVDEVKYRMFDLGPSRAGREAGFSVNSNGWVVGNRWVGPGWVWRPDRGWFQLPTYRGFRFTVGRAVNDKNEIACMLDGGGRNQAAVWSEAEGLRLIPMPPGLIFLWTFGMNDKGEIVGWAQQGESSIARGWLYRPGPGPGAVALGPAPGPSTALAKAVNGNTDVVGDSVLKKTLTAVAWPGGEGLTVLGHPPEGGVYVQCVNDHGDIAVQEGTIGVPQNVRWADGRWEDLSGGTVGEFFSAFWVTNDRWVFGLGAIDGVGHAAVWRPGIGARFLSELVDSSKDGYTIHAILQASKNGLLTGWASKPGDRLTRPILLVPYPRKTKGG